MVFSFKSMSLFSLSRFSSSAASMASSTVAVGWALTGRAHRTRGALAPDYPFSSPSTRLSSTALLATIIELSDIRSADHSGLSSMP